MKCHYEVLGVPRDADDAEIKSAYRKLALRWHPDKNLDSPEEAKEQFQLVQQAYEVISDPHERAWYDNHREQILRGKNSDYEDNCLDVFQYFTVSCFKGYGDDPQGFYHVYSEVFEKIAAEDLEFMEEEELEEIPRFGDSKSSYEEVVGPFYAYWQSYCTKRSYTWLCPYNINEIKDRRILRGIEKDMKKVVQKAKRERNEEVRNLVSFVRKRDKRVQAYKKILEDRAVLNRQKQEQIRLDQIRQRKKEMEELQKSRNGPSNSGYEEQLRQLEAEYSDSEDYESEDESADGEDFTEEDFLAAFEAGLCCKECLLAFKTKDAFTNHIQTKKHKDAVEKLRIEVQDGLYLTEQTNAESSPRESGSEGEEEEIKEAKQKSKKGKKKKSQFSQEPLEEEEIPDLLTNLADEEDNWEETPNKSSKKSKAKKTNQKKSNPKDSSAKSEQPKIPNGTTHNEKPDKEDQNGIDVAHTCVTCNTVFDSKNKLFNHLKKTNHGVYIPKKSSGSLDQSSKVPLHASTKKGRRNK